MALYTSSPESRSRNAVTLRLARVLAALAVAALFPFLFGLDFNDFERLAQWGIVRFLGLGLIATVTTSLVSIVLSLPLATLLALARFARRTPQAYLSAITIEFIRALPILLVILYINVRFTALRRVDDAITLSGIWNTLFGSLVSQQGLAVVLALTIYTAVVNAELIRSGMGSLDRGQFEAARAVGLSYAQMMRLVILPQTFRRVLPGLIAQFTTLVKDTSLGAIIGFVELQRSAQIIYQQPGYNALAVLYVAALIYFVLNYILGKVSEAIQRRRGRVPQRLQVELEAGA